MSKAYLGDGVYVVDEDVSQVRALTRPNIVGWCGAWSRKSVVDFG
jgi:hypothetical protein